MRCEDEERDMMEKKDEMKCFVDDDDGGDEGRMRLIEDAFDGFRCFLVPGWLVRS